MLMLFGYGLLLGPVSWIFVGWFGDVLLKFLCDIHTVTCACDLMKMVHRQQVFDHENGVLKINTESRESWL